MNITSKLLSMVALAALVSFSSCGDDDEPATPAKVQPNTYTARLLGAQNNAAGSFFSSANGLVYGAADSAAFVANKVDLSFAQTGTGTTQPKLVSLDQRRAEGLSRQTTINRITTFGASTLTKAQFDTIGNVAVTNLAVGSDKSIVVAQGSLYTFRNDESKRGLIYVSRLDAGTGANGSITIDVKVQK